MTDLTRAHVHVIITLLDICIYSCSDLMLMRSVALMACGRPMQPGDVHDFS